MGEALEGARSDRCRHRAGSNRASRPPAARVEPGRCDQRRGSKAATIRVVAGIDADRSGLRPGS